MIEVSSTDAVNRFHHFLNEVSHGETVRIRKHGRPVARMVPDCDFMPGSDFAKLFNTSGMSADLSEEVSSNVASMKERAREKLDN